MSGKFFFSWYLRVCTWVFVGVEVDSSLLFWCGKKELSFALIFEYLFIRWTRSEKKSFPFFLSLFFFEREEGCFSFLLDVWWSCLDDLDLKRKVGLPPFFFFYFCEERGFPLPWRLSIFLLDDLGQKEKFSSFFVLSQLDVRTFSLFLYLDFWESFTRWSQS